MSLFTIILAKSLSEKENLSRNEMLVKVVAVVMSIYRNRKKMHQGKAAVPCSIKHETIPRISRLVALAIRFEGLIRRGELQDYADYLHPVLLS